MPTYDYHCEANGKVVEVGHRMNESLATWGELCKRAGIDPGATPADSPVKKLATGGNFIPRSSMGSGTEPPCGMDGGCGGGACGYADY